MSSKVNAPAEVSARVTKAGVNDFVIRFANVNGTGSASANFLFAKSVFRMGVPVSPKNIFPSNIQGAPTWYEVRVSEKGYLGRREGIDFIVAMNAQSMKEDVDSVKKGGFLLYDSTRPLHPEFIREDVNYIGIPLMEICNREYSDARQRLLFKNVMYVGALSHFLGIEFAVLEKLVSEQFAGKEKLIAPNVKALQLGINYAKENYTSLKMNMRIERRDLVKDMIVIDGNTACGLGAVYAGATVAAWYPITPSTSVVEAFTSYCHEFRIDKTTGKNNFAIVQAEDELAAIGMVIGANWNGARAFTATSGPGVSLMSEFLGLAYYAEVPAVLIDVQRVGPSTGMPTKTQQSDILKAAYSSHGDTKHVLIIPSDPKECFELTAMAFDLAEQLQTPVIVMSDLDLGMNDHVSPSFNWDDTRKYERGKVMTKEQLDSIKRFGRYLDVDDDGITWRTLPGTHPTKGAGVTRGTARDEYNVYTEDPGPYTKNMDRLNKKFVTARSYMPKPILLQQKNSSESGVIFYGSSTHPTEEALDTLKEKGLILDAMRVRSFPFPKEVEEFIAAHKKIFVVEQNRDAQMRSLLSIELCIDPNRFIPVLHYDGFPITADFIAETIEKKLKSKTASKTVN